jgi:hypothetical protein
MNLDSISQELDRLYEFEISKYIARCDELKKSGFKVYRNSSGQHKVVLAGRSNQSEPKRTESFETGKIKKENIFIRAKNRIKRSIANIRAVIRFIKLLNNQNNGNI